MVHAEQHVVELTHEPFGHGFDVKVRPPITGEPLDAEFQDYRQARAWASGLRQTRGWRLIDRTGLTEGQPG